MWRCWQTRVLAREKAEARDRREWTRALLEDARSRRDLEVERTRGLEVKAAFVVAVASLTTGSISSGLLATEYWWIAAISATGSALALAAAIHALWPLKVKTPDSAEMKLNAQREGWDAAQLELALLNLVIDETAVRQHAYGSRWRSLRVSFVLLALGLVTSVVGTVILSLNS